MTMFHRILTLMLPLAAAIAASAQINIIPLPASATQAADGTCFTFADTTRFSVAPSPRSEAVGSMLDRFAGDLAASTGSVWLPAQHGAPATVMLADDPTLGAEAYRLTIRPEGITIESSTPAGAFYALQSVRQMAESCGEVSRASIPASTIADEPRFGWRGFMLDEGRHFFGKDEVKRILDIMALCKMNRFHWHLTEDQGWRIEIKSWPLLTEKGASRLGRRLGNRNRPADSLRYEGHYTHDDIREIVAYARDRFIEIVPEIDIPGHTEAAVAAYPAELACDPSEPHAVRRTMGISDDVMNVASAAAVKMSKDIIDELIELFPFEYIHLGGDECPTGKWQKNEACRQRLAEIGSENYRDLQLDFYRRLAEHIAAKPAAERRKLIFWNETLHGNPALLPDSAVIMAWVDAEREALEAARRGLPTILSPQIPFYINRRQSANPDEPETQGRGAETIESVYSYQPMSQTPDSLAGQYLGVQANVWSEFVETPRLLEYLMMPRLAAVAETAWTPASRRSLPDFAGRINSLRPMLDRRGWNYAPHIFTRRATPSAD